MHGEGDDNALATELLRRHPRLLRGARVMDTVNARTLHIRRVLYLQPWPATRNELRLRLPEFCRRGNGIEVQVYNHDDHDV
jgi:hypothetical protein